MAATKRSAQQRITRDFLDGVITPKEYIDHICNEQFDSTGQWRADHLRMHDLEKRALDVAAVVVSKELEHLNQLRQDVVKDRDQFARREALEAAIKLFEKRLDDIEKMTGAALQAEKDSNATKFSAIDKKLAYFAGVVGGYGFLLTIILVFHDHIIDMFSGK